MRMLPCTQWQPSGRYASSAAQMTGNWRIHLRPGSAGRIPVGCAANAGSCTCTAGKSRCVLNACGLMAASARAVAKQRWHSCAWITSMEMERHIAKRSGEAHIRYSSGSRGTGGLRDIKSFAPIATWLKSGRKAARTSKTNKKEGQWVFLGMSKSWVYH